MMDAPLLLSIFLPVSLVFVLVATIYRVRVIRGSPKFGQLPFQGLGF